jgi:hypothetical protein
MTAKKHSARAATKSTARKKPAKKTAKRTTKKAPVDRATILNVTRPGSSKTIPRDKYDLISAAILAVLPKAGDGVALTELPELVDARLSSKERNAIGSIGQIGWHVMAVKLDLEARKRIERVPGSNPQRLRRVASSRPSSRTLRLRA